MRFSLKSKMSAGKKIKGIMIKDFSSPIIINILDECGYDFIVLDQEHGPTSYQDIQNFAIAAKELRIAIIVRPPKIDYETIARTLDMGAEGLMIPHVDSSEQAKQIIEYAKYPPLGKRSYGMRKNLTKIQFKNAKDFIDQENQQTVIFIQAESPESSKNMKDILNFQEIDGVIMGPADYTMNLGKPGDYTNKKFVKQAESIMEICNKKKKGFGIHFGKWDLFEAWKKKGMNILLYSSISGIIKDQCVRITKRME